MSKIDAIQTSAAIAKPNRGILYTALIGAAGLAVLLQALWAAIFLEHDGQRDDAAGWIDVHARGGEVAIVLALASAAVAFVWMRARKDLWVGSSVLAVLLMGESYLGGLIRDDSKDALTVVHIPLAMALMGLAVWLPLRAARRPDRAQPAAAGSPVAPVTRTVDIAETLQAVATTVEKMAVTVNAFAHHGSESANAVDAATSVVDAARATLTDLAETSTRINEAASTISQIASQTGLLALNATIEANRPAPGVPASEPTGASGGTGTAPSRDTAIRGG